MSLTTNSALWKFNIEKHMSDPIQSPVWEEKFEQDI